MSIASRITSIEEHIGNAYNKLDDLGIDLSNVDKNIDNIAEMLDTVYEEYPKVPGQGTEVTLDGTKKGKMGLDIKGNSTQETTTGKNFYDVSSLPVTQYGITISRNENGDIVLNGTPNYTSSYRTFSIGVGKELEIGTYTVSVANKKDGIGVNVGGFGGQLNLTMADTVKTKTATSTQAYTIAPQLNIRYDVGTLTNFVLNPMLEKSASATTYEPYTGGIASPNPSYPQPILSAGDNNSISEKIVNKNLADWEYGEINYSTGAESSSTTRIRTKQVIPLNNGDTIAYVTNLTNAVGIRLYEKDGTFISSPSFSSTTHTYTNNLGRNVYARFRVALETGETLENAQVQVEYGDPTTYTAHQEQTYTIPVQQPMRSIGTVRDEFIQVNGEWKERHNIKNTVLNGTENIRYFSVAQGSLFRVIIAKSISDTIPYSNYFKGVANATYRTNNTFYYNKGASTSENIFDFIDNRYSNETDFANWLSTQYTNGVPVYLNYIADVPTDLPCTAEQIAILENLPKSYNEQTNIYSLDVTPAYFDAEALLDINEAIGGAY